MANNILSNSACEQFFLLRDSLAVFAHSWLEIEEDLFAVENPQTFGSLDLYHENVLRDTLSEVWCTPEIIDDFVESLPPVFPGNLKSAALTWRNPVSGLFTVFKHAGKTLFMKE